jgi:hypothetical protein
LISIDLVTPRRWAFRGSQIPDVDQSIAIWNLASGAWFNFSIFAGDKSWVALADQWDRRIEADIQAGRLDSAGRLADEEFDAGRCTPISS